jgi:hypothetical protein
MENQEQVPSSFERQLTPEEEKAVLINFMGNTYGEVKKLDGNIVGSSTSLGGRSDSIKQHIEQIVKSSATNTTPVREQPIPVQAPEPIAPVPVQVPQISLNSITEPISADDQLTFNFDVNEKAELFTLIEKILTRLDKLHRKVDELTLVHSDFIQTYQQAQSIVAKKKSTSKGRASTKKEN